LKLLADQELRARLGLAARERATQLFSWDRLAIQAEAAYCAALR
jgi:glycosyltransferase involved in cell wall biosynthesis